MQFSFSSLALAMVGLAVAATTSNNEYTTIMNGITYNVFALNETSRILYVKNSGVCETTPGVDQYSGYLEYATNQFMWFWFFESRSNPEEAPLGLWLNGGPGCSSMIGLFQENGPCQFYNGSSLPQLNPHSWNNHVNMLYVDQPIGTGFSFGTGAANGTVSASEQVWVFFQTFLKAFPKYSSRDFGLFTESYGGHYGPQFADYFLKQNDAIEEGSVSGQKINLVALGINNGWFDEGIQQGAYIDYAYGNPYRTLIHTELGYKAYMADYQNLCLPAAEDCTGVTGNITACIAADAICESTIDEPLSSSADFNAYDIRESSDSEYPPETYVEYLYNPIILAKIGAISPYKECGEVPYAKFAATGDSARPFLDTLSDVVDRGVQVLIWAGDADWICNYLGGLYVVGNLTFIGSSSFAQKQVEPYTVDGAEYGLFKTQDNISWLQVYEAGHEVPYYQPQVALQAFEQTMSKKALRST
ncbi:Carboxypeptidase [Pleurostoma richardsiae]|uniref:Carboxypeptidase n=1 Tax=Pleurostoma richardsiae TaxID=41990 RepID=A0AA38R3G7_9PEZI|nr:Carboxypeptidase [Pleurostoma richardsiae]